MHCASTFPHCTLCAARALPGIVRRVRGWAELGGRWVRGRHLEAPCHDALGKPRLPDAPCAQLANALCIHL